jgi:branched-chain amino acid transport system substrate-binding protein
MRATPVIVSIVLVVLVAIGISFEEDSGPQGGAKIGALMPMTGGLQVYGQTSLNGVRMAVDEVNAAGGVLGGPLGLSVGDTQTNPQAGVDAAKRLVETEGVAGLVGALSSGVTIPVASSVSSVDGVPQISGASTSPVITGLADKDFLFRTVPSDALQGVILADVMQKKGLDRIGIVYLNNDYGQGLAEAIEGAFTGTIASMVAFEEKQASFRAELQKAKDGGAETLVLIGYPGDGIPMLRQALEEQLFAKFVFTDGMKAQEVVDAIGGDLLEGAYGTAPSADADAATAKAFKALYETKYGELPPQPFIDAAYDAAILLALAIEKAGTTEGTAVRDALRAVAGPPGRKFGPGQFAAAKAALNAGEDIDYEGAAGSQDFDANGDVPGTYTEWAIRGGKVEDVNLIRP